MLNQIANRVYVSEILWDLVKSKAPSGAGVFDMGLGEKFLDFDTEEEAVQFLTKTMGMNL